jgi:hypothetical protein
MCVPARIRSSKLLLALASTFLFPGPANLMNMLFCLTTLGVVQLLLTHRVVRQKNILDNLTIFYTIFDLINVSLQFPLTSFYWLRCLCHIQRWFKQKNMICSMSKMMGQVCLHFRFILDVSPRWEINISLFLRDWLPTLLTICSVSRMYHHSNIPLHHKSSEENGRKPYRTCQALMLISLLVVDYWVDLFPFQWVGWRRSKLSDLYLFCSQLDSQSRHDKFPF